MSSTLEPERDTRPDDVGHLPPLEEPVADVVHSDAGLEPLALVGRGGSSDVWLARDVDTGAHFAVKLVRPELAADAAACARVAHEGRILSGLDHPNVVGYRGTRTLADGRVALLLEYVDGEPLGDLLTREGALPPPRAARILLDVARGLAHAHEAGIVHGDVGDCNVLVERGTGRAVVIDFGVARLAGEPPAEDGLAGTPAFMSPEQIDGRPLDPRSDLYSLALVGWTLLAGVSPWDGCALDVILHRQRFVLPPSARTIRDDVARPIADAIDRALKKDPRARWESVQAFIDAIERPPVPRDSARGAPRAQDPDAGAARAEASEEWADDATERATERARPGRLARIAAGAALSGTVLLGLLFSAPRIAPDRTATVVDAVVARAEPALAEAPLLRRALLGFVGRAGGVEAGVVADDPWTPESTPAPLQPLLLPLPALDTALVRGPEHDCRVLPSGVARCAGENMRGQLGIGRRPAPRALTTRMAGTVAGGRRWRMIDIGLSHSCALDVEGGAWCWGANTLGQLGTGTGGGDRFAPVRVAGDLRFTALVVGERHGCALERTGRVWCWGSNVYGQVGDGTVTSRLRPVPVATDARFVAIAAGTYHTCGLTPAGDAWCWGVGATGAPAALDDPASLLPARIEAPVRFARLEGGSERPCAITGADRRWCWGGSYGRQALPDLSMR